MTSDLLSEMRSNVDERRRRMVFLQFSDEDEQRIRQLEPLFNRHAQAVSDKFYEHLLSIEETRAILQDEQVFRRLKQAQEAYFRRITQGNYDGDYFENRLRVGIAHEKANIPPKFYLGAYSLYFRLVMDLLFEEYRNQPEKARGYINSLCKLFFLDITLAMDTYLTASKMTIQKQQELIWELSTPVIQIWDGVLALPLVGTIDSNRTQQIMENLLNEIVRTQSSVVILDITGVPLVDTQVANHLFKTMQAAQLLGARSILVGISPQIAQTLVQLGVDLGAITTGATLKHGLQMALKYLKKEYDLDPTSPAVEV